MRGYTSQALRCDAPLATHFIGSDTTTQGNWQGAYGADGYNIIQDAVSYPSYATVSETGTSNNTWSTTTTDVRALEQTITGRIAADWYSATTFTVDINLTDGNPHKVSIYCLDWDETTRTQTVAVLDAVSGTVLNTQDLNTSFNGGIYLSWTIRGHVQLVFTNTNMTYNAVVSGLFFDSFPTAPTGGYGVVAAGAGLTRSIGVDSNGYPVVRQYHTDGQGSVLAITDGLGNVVTGYQIDAWGNVLYGGAPGNAFDYLGGLGYWADPDLSLHYVRARWMNPAFGNWLSVDPHLDEFAYQYANNMPTTGSDPSGKDAELEKALGVFEGKHPENLTPHQIRLILKDATTTGLGKDRYLTVEGLAALEALYFAEINSRSAKNGTQAPSAASPGQGPGINPTVTNQKPRAGSKPAGPNLDWLGIPGVTFPAAGHTTPNMSDAQYRRRMAEMERSRKAYLQSLLDSERAELYGPGVSAVQMRQFGGPALAARYAAQQQAADKAEQRQFFAAVHDQIRLEDIYGYGPIPAAAVARAHKNAATIGQYNRTHSNDHGSIVNHFIPHWDEAAEEATDLSGGLARFLTGLIDSIPLILATGGLGEAAGVTTALTRAFQITGAVGVGRQLADVKAWKADPLGHGAETFCNGLLVFGPMAAGRSGAAPGPSRQFATILSPFKSESATQVIAPPTGWRGRFIVRMANAYDARDGKITPRPLKDFPNDDGTMGVIQAFYDRKLNEISVNSEHFTPGTLEYKRLVAHELFHVWIRSNPSRTETLDFLYGKGGVWTYSEEFAAEYIKTGSVKMSHSLAKGYYGASGFIQRMSAVDFDPYYYEP